jgi:hypothetical protein
MRAAGGSFFALSTSGLSVMRCFGLLLSLLVATLLIERLTASAIAAPPIDLEVIVEDRSSITAQQEWLKRLGGLKLAGLTIRNAREGEETEIVNRGSEARPRYKIVAILTRNDQLILQGGKFGRNDMNRLRAYFETLGSQGVAGVTKSRSLFGLTGEQLIALTKNLEPIVDFETKGLDPSKAIAQLAANIEPAIVVSATARRALSDAATCRDELRGITSGTALAVLVRPYGLVVQPTLAGRNVELRIVKPVENTEAWPVGWPLEVNEKAAIPALMEFINVEIKDIELPQALAALQERLAAPFLFDHNQLAKHGIEPEKIEVSVPAGRSYYKRILERVLFQSKLKSEIRTDELGKPIVWITTIKP